MIDEEDIYDMYRRHRTEKREKNAVKQLSAKEIVEKWAAEKNVHLQVLADWQLRLTKDKFKVDIYPTKQRYHIITNNQRGGYRNLNEVLEYLFKGKL